MRRANVFEARLGRLVAAMTIGMALLARPALAAPAAAPDAANWGAPASAQPAAGAEVERHSTYVRMPDGVRLAVDVWLPKGTAPGSRLPTILEQTRYYRSATVKTDPSGACHAAGFAAMKAFAAHGYAYVVVDVRGTGASFGSRPAEYSDAEVADGSRIVDWIVGQPWSNGKVGATGQSYVGTTAELLLRDHNPAVKAVAPTFSGYDFYSEIAQPGGIQNTGFDVYWPTGNRGLDTGHPPAASPIVSVCPVDEDKDRSLLRQAIAEHAGNFDMASVLGRLGFRDDAVQGRAIDQPSPYRFQRQIDAAHVPVYAVVGWYDSAYALGGLRRMMTTASKSDRLLVGPWNHGGHFFYEPGVQAATPDAFDLTSEKLRFFDHYLKGIDNGFSDTPPIRYFTSGADRWSAADQWPPKGAAPTAWSLAANGGLARSGAGGEGADRYASPGDETYAEFSRWHSTMGPYPAFYPDRQAADRTILTYTSAPLDQDLEVTGDPVLTLYAAIDRPDADLFVYLEQVGPDGRVDYVTDGQLRVSRRRSGRLAYANPGPQHTDLRADARAAAPGSPMRLEVTLLPMSHVFKRGERIRLAIAGADRGQFRDHPVAPVVWTVFRGGVRPSSLTLPVMGPR